MDRRITLLIVVAVIVFASIGMSYACDDFTKFEDCGFWDNECVGCAKDIAAVTAHIDSSGNLNISVSKAYPYYEAYVNFTIKHIGSSNDPTVYLKDIDIINPYAGVEMDITVTYLNGDPIPIGTSLNPGDTLEGLVTISMLDGADHDQTYEFSIHIIFSDEQP